jgi:hypothetical protein
MNGASLKDCCYKHSSLQVLRNVQVYCAYLESVDTEDRLRIQEFTSLNCFFLFKFNLGRQRTYINWVLIHEHAAYFAAVVSVCALPKLFGSQKSLRIELFQKKLR